MKSGSEDVEITFDSTDLAGHIVVVYEYLYDSSGELIAPHADISDTKQTIYFPGIGTTATDAETGIDVSYADEEVTIVDVVEYTNVQTSRTYTITGTLYDRETGEAVQDADGNTITSSATFKATESSGTVELTFTFNGSLLAGTSVVAFETLERNNVIYAVHEDITDEGQTVHFPKVGTTAADSETGENASCADGSITISDLVAYENIDAGYEYTVVGIICDADTGEKLTVDGEEVTATRTLSADESSGTLRMEFTFDGAGMEGRTLVVYEYIYYNGGLVASHEDPDDTGQQIRIPKIGTKVQDSETGSDVSYADGDVTVVDTVTYENLLTDREYTVTGTLYDQDTGEVMTDDEGNDITASTIFTPTESSGIVEVTFTFSGVKLAGTTAVAYESLERNGHTYAVHADITDEAQTEYFPEISTSMTDSETADHIAKADEEVTLTDTVTYTNLPVGQEFTVTGVLMDAESGEAILNADGSEVTASATFTTTDHDGTVDVIYTFDASELAGHSVVSFETLYVNGEAVAKHEDITDEGQTVVFPEVHTNASDLVTGTDVANSDEMVTIEDVVIYENVIAGKEYTITGILVDKSTGDYFLDDNGEAVTASVTFTAEKTSGTVTLVFTLSAKSLGSATLVAFESLTYKDVEVGVHADITDADQTVYLPKIGTTALDSETGVHVSYADDTVTVIDTVSYTDLSPNHTYNVIGTLMDMETQEVLVIHGETVTAAAEFTPESSDGTVEVLFTFDASELSGSTLVVFERLYLGDFLAAAHTDFADEEQFIYVPKIGTTATDSETNDHISYADSKIIINDLVSYTDLQPGVAYTIKGVLYDRESGEVLLVNEKEVTAFAEFTAKAAEGEVTVTFEFDGTGLENRTLVAYEYLYYEDILVAEHEDMEDEEQSVYIPQISTTATEKNTGSKTVSAGEVTVIDTITYENLVPGLEYTVFGTVMNSETGKAVEINGEKVTAEMTFTPEKNSGTVDVEFTFDASSLAGTTIVWFEEVYYGDAKIAAHSDINDTDQSIDVKKAVKNHPETGDGSRMYIAIVLLAAAAVLLVAARRRKSRL